MADKKNKYHYLLEILLFSCLGCFSLLFLAKNTDIPIRYHEVLTRIETFAAVILLFSGVGLSLAYLNRKVRNVHSLFLKDRRQQILFFVTSAVLLFVLNYLLLVSVKWIIDIEEPFAIAGTGLKALITIWLMELIIVSQFQVNIFYRKLIALYKRTSELEESSIRAQYTALQSQLNPHFLFNSLNTLISEIEYRPSTAVEFTRNLSDVYRYILWCQDKQLIPLKSELDFLESYVFLHKVRLGDCLTIDNRIDFSYWDVQVPPLTLQLLVENIIKHNVINPNKPVSITIDINLQQRYISVSNEIHPRLDVPSSGKGLQNLSLRYLLLCGEDIVIERSDKIFTVKVPLLNGE